MSGAGEQRVVIITGASRGLGKAIALRFGSAGDRVVVNFVHQKEAAESVAERIAALGGTAMTYQADVRSSSDVDSMIEKTVKQWGKVDVFVNNAGMTSDRLFVRMTEQDWDDVVNTNLGGAFRCIRSVSRIMAERKDGYIINISSISGIQGRQGQANYAASKAGLIGLTKACAKELGPSNIKVNTVLPGYLPSDMSNIVSDDMHARILKENVLGRSTDLTDVADFVYHLSFMKNTSGQVFNLDSRIL